MTRKRYLSFLLAIKSFTIIRSLTAISSQNEVSKSLFSEKSPGTDLQSLSWSKVSRKLQWGHSIYDSSVLLPWRSSLSQGIKGVYKLQLCVDDRNRRSILLQLSDFQGKLESVQKIIIRITFSRLSFLWKSNMFDIKTSIYRLIWRMPQTFVQTFHEQKWCTFSQSYWLLC